MKQRKYMIFGITGGIGSALGMKLKQQAHKVYGFGRDADRLQRVTSEVCDGSQVLDTQDWQAVRSSITKSKEELDGLDGVAVCIGSLLLKPAHLTSREEWNDVMHTHVSTAFGILAAAAHAMMRTGGSIVLTASAASRIGMANHEAVAAAKGAIIGLTLSAAATYAAKGIRVNCVAPGLVETPLTEALLSSDVNRKASQGMHALGRLGSPEDVAYSMAWLLSEECSWVTGQVLGVDGGLGSVLPRMRA